MSLLPLPDQMVVRTEAQGFYLAVCNCLCSSSPGATECVTCEILVKFILSPCKLSQYQSLLKSGTTNFHSPVYWVPLGVCNSVTLWPLKTSSNQHHLQGALKFAAQISPLLNFMAIENGHYQVYLRTIW